MRNLKNFAYFFFVLLLANFFVLFNLVMVVIRVSVKEYNSIWLGVARFQIIMSCKSAFFIFLILQITFQKHAHIFFLNRQSFILEEHFLLVMVLNVFVETFVVVFGDLVSFGNRCKHFSYPLWCLTHFVSFEKSQGISKFLLNLIQLRHFDEKKVEGKLVILLGYL